MSDLIARLEKATGPDRQLDLAIHTAIFGQPSEDDLDELLAPEAYTDSVDAALALVPEGWRVYAIQQHHYGDLRWYAGLDEINGSGVVNSENCSTPALALCIVVMKAREPRA